ncbi:MAG TPA: multicopper oxidase family protein [Conexibacter sp.]|nr:multicopper oxidase family protein [Conexibacter sp.]
MRPAVTRRTAIRYGAGALAAALAAPELLRAPRAGATLGPGTAPVARAAQALGPELRRPRVLRSRRGRLDVKLVCKPGVVDMGAPAPVRTWTYDGLVPGNTWELRGGDVLRVDLRNRLPELRGEGDHDHATMDRPHEWTTTNLHTHGLHVSPRGNSDNVFLAVPPGERQRYEIELPEDHPAGLFWYHPHRHGGVCQQVRAGMAGLLIVRGDLDDVPEVRAAKERILVMQAIEVGPDYALMDPIPNPTKEQAFFPRTNLMYTVNGRMKPTITMYPGEVQRWRLLNAAEGKFMSLALEGHDLHVLGWDGLTLAEPEGEELLMMSAGNRVEALVQAGRPGVYELMLTPGSSQRPNIPGMPRSADQDEVAATASRRAQLLLCDLSASAASPRAGAAQSPDAQPPELQPRSIATVVVRGSGPRMRLPRDLPAFRPPRLKVVRRRRFEFTVERDPDNEFLSFGVDGRPFAMGNKPYRARLGTAEEWTLVNGTDNKLADHAHVYHVHVNPFKITAINGRRLSRPQWRDTQVLTGQTGDSLTFEVGFTDFTGRFVEHCHVLSHEDLGMMNAIEVVRR